MGFGFMDCRSIILERVGGGKIPFYLDMQIFLRQRYGLGLRFFGGCGKVKNAGYKNRIAGCWVRKKLRSGAVFWMID